LDNLKVILIATIIAGHGIAGYSELEFWPYSEMKEVELSPVTQTVLYTIAGPFSLLLIPMLFLVAGLHTRASLDRKNPGRYARDRLMRLGVPFAGYVLLLQPLLMYPVHPPGETPGDYWTEFVGAEERMLWPYSGRSGCSASPSNASTDRFGGPASCQPCRLWCLRGTGLGPHRVGRHAAIAVNAGGGKGAHPLATLALSV
jgi:hypothetical protein